MPTYHFTGPKVTAKRTGNCPTCGRKTTRSQTFEKTVNPFNKRDDGTPKSWDEVRADVQAEAAAWAPGPEVFEHDAYLAARTAPPRSAPVGVSAKRAVQSRQIRDAMTTLAALADRSGLPVTVADFCFNGQQPVATIAFVPDGEIVAWARALGLADAPIEDGGHCTYVRLRADLDGIVIRVHAAISKPQVGDRLGGAPIEWDRDSRGKKTGHGTVPVGALAEGLAVMGIAVVDPTLVEHPGGAE
jgi:hypothetical protein